MSTPSRALRSSLLPLGAFVATLGLHFLWLGLFPEKEASQALWADLPSEGAAATGAR